MKVKEILNLEFISCRCFQDLGSVLLSQNEEVTEPKQQPPRDPLLQLVSLQKASGCWLLDPALAAAVGKTSEEVENTKPSAVSRNTKLLCYFEMDFIMWFLVMPLFQKADRIKQNIAMMSNIRKCLILYWKNIYIL